MNIQWWNGFGNTNYVCVSKYEHHAMIAINEKHLETSECHIISKEKGDNINNFAGYRNHTDIRLFLICAEWYTEIDWSFKGHSKPGSITRISSWRISPGCTQQPRRLKDKTQLSAISHSQLQTRLIRLFLLNLFLLKIRIIFNILWWYSHRNYLLQSFIIFCNMYFLIFWTKWYLPIYVWKLQLGIALHMVLAKKFK